MTDYWKEEERAHAKELLECCKDADTYSPVDPNFVATKQWSQLFFDFQRGVSAHDFVQHARYSDGM